MSADAWGRGLALRINQRLFYGWVILGVAVIGAFATGPGQSYVFSIFVTPLSKDLDISRSAIAFAYAGASLVAAFALPYVGRLIDRLGVRWMLMVIVALLSASAIGFGLVTNLLLLVVGFVALRMLGQGALMMSCQNVVSQWFARKRGFALSIVALGFALSVAVHPPLAQWLTDRYGWRVAWVMLGCLTALLLPLVFLLVQNKPEALGLSPDGPTERRSDKASENVDSDEMGLPLAAAMRTPAFWVIGLSIGTLSMLLTALFFYQVSVFEQHGMSTRLAASIFPLSAAVMVVSMPFIGWLLDRFSSQSVFAAGLLVGAASSVLLALANDNASALAYGVVFGITNAVFHTHLGYLWPRFFGRKHLGSIQGAGATMNVIGGSLGALPLGVAFDITGQYTLTLFAISALPAICAAMVLLMKPPKLES